MVENHLCPTRVGLVSRNLARPTSHTVYLRPVSCPGMVDRPTHTTASGLTRDQTPGVVNDDNGGSRTEHTAECDTLVGRLAGLLLDRTKPDMPDLHEVRKSKHCPQAVEKYWFVKEREIERETLSTFASPKFVGPSAEAVFDPELPQPSTIENDEH